MLVKFSKIIYYKILFNKVIKMLIKTDLFHYKAIHSSYNQVLTIKKHPFNIKLIKK